MHWGVHHRDKTLINSSRSRWVEAACSRIANHARVELDICYCYRYRDLLSLLWDLECDGYVSNVIPSAFLSLSLSVYGDISLYFQMRDSGAIREAGGALRDSTGKL